MCYGFKFALSFSQLDNMKLVTVAAVAVVVDATASNVSGNCYEIAPSNQHYQLVHEAKGNNFFDDMVFANGPAQTNGAAHYLDKGSAFDEGIIETTETNAYMRVGEPFDTSDGPRRHSVHVSTNRRYKHFLAAMRYQHVPFGLGVWPAFWTNGAAPWPQNGELDILEYASHAGQKVSVHTGDSNHCKLSPQLVQQCGEMFDSNGMGFDCYTNYGQNRLGCAPTTYAGQREPEYWSSNPGAMVVEWTDRFMKVFYFEEAAIPADLDSETPQPDTWDEKWVIAYFPFAGSNEQNPGSCPNPADVLGPQEIIMNIELCGDWAGGSWSPEDADPGSTEWRGKRDRGECDVSGYHHASDCCSNYIGQPEMNDYLRNNSFWDVEYLKVFQLASGPPNPEPAPAPAPAPPPAPTPSSTCTDSWFSDTDCGGGDILNKAVKDVGDCCELCSATAGCGAFTHNVWDGHNDATCYLKKSCTEEQKKGKRGCMSGIPAQITPAPAPTPTPPGQCGGNYLDSVDCAGADVADKAMDNADGCCQWCSETPGCTAFTQNMVDGHGSPHCYLKESCEESKQGWNGAAISGAGIAQDSSRRRRSTTPAPTPAPAPAGPGCCSWSGDDSCGQADEYCRSNADACGNCGGHWVDTDAPPKVLPTENCCSWNDQNVCADGGDYCAANSGNCAGCGGHWVPPATEMLI